MSEKVPPQGAVSSASAQPSSMHNQRLSFASVAAMVPPSNKTVTSPKPLSKTDKAYAPVLPADSTTHGHDMSDNMSPRLDESLSRLGIKDGQIPIPDVPDHELQAPLQMRPQLDDEKTHLSFSSTKAPSLDGKSVASVATFALDEKESIRPDESASVKGAEDDDSNSGPASGAPNSRVGSEAGARAFGNQFNEISERIGPSVYRAVPGIRRPVPGVTEELRRVQIGSPSTNSSGAGITRADATIGGNNPPYTLPAVPDEKILDAMESPKDRIFLLSLEQQVISFIRDSSDPVLSLPPCNSFCRLLAHRLGDYYALGHVLDNSQSAVQLHRTPHCQLRPPLTSFEAKPPPSSGSGGPSLSMKIMRRTEIVSEGRPESSGTNTADDSVGPSVAASEVDSDNQKTSGLVSPAESTSAKDKAVTREEREAKYKEARERIFADWKEGDSNEPNQSEGNDASRASSANGKKKNKKKTNNDDSFDSRSAYNAYYPSPQRPGPVYDQTGQPINYVPQFMPQNNGAIYPNGYPSSYGQQYPQIAAMQGYQMPVPTQQQIPGMTGVYPSISGQQPYGQYSQHMQGYFPSMHPQNPMVSQPSQSMPSPTSSNHSAQMSRPQSQMSDQGWNQNMYPAQYQGFQNSQPQFSGQNQHQHAMTQMSQASVPYAFGQLPYQPNGQGSRPIHPIPGSYNRQTQFNSSPNRM